MIADLYFFWSYIILYCRCNFTIYYHYSFQACNCVFFWYEVVKMSVTAALMDRVFVIWLIQVVGVEPAERSVISGENPGEEPCWFIFLI